ncbi:unnamed protein product [Rotaria magnacalcarata]|nr:unnamed protein product [Rotaria magnacalcarata]CAF3915686.1 unnamed protein product [Rotaria magnacalcarata]
MFCFIACNYDLKTLVDNSDNSKNELTQALYSPLNAMQTILQLPTLLKKIIDIELNMTSEMRAERKRISFIASLVTLLQKDEKLEASKREEQKKSFSYGITSTSVSWFIYFMSKTLEVQKKIKKGLSEYNGQRLSIKHMDSFIYLECVLDEVLRLVARVLGTTRTLTTNDQLPKSGFQFKTGDKLYWADLCDLNEFHPEIYLNDPENQNNLGALMPFGGEHRMCMNEDLARLELK